VQLAKQEQLVRLETQVLPVRPAQQALVKLVQQVLLEIQVLPVQLVQLVRLVQERLARLEIPVQQA
jgi:hypothetical protein